MPLPSVSVVVTIHNVEVWVEEAIASVAHQTWPGALNIVLVDVESTDDSVARAEETLRKYGRPYRLVRTSNRGPSHARNVGWQSAVGEWIQFLDADDVLHRCKLERQLQCAPATRSDVASIYSPWIRLEQRHAGWQPYGEVVTPCVEGDSVAELLAPSSFIQIGAQLFRRSWLETVAGFDERHWLIEDVDLLLRIAMQQGRFHEIAAVEPLFFYRQRRDSLSRRSGDEFVEGCLRNASMVVDFYERHGGLTRRQREVVADVYLHACRHYAARDPLKFDMLVQKLERLIPHFVPKSPRRLRIASQFVGYRRAEQVAMLFRHLKRHFPLHDPS